MARTIRDSGLETRAARSRLKPRRKPYYRSLEEGLHIGFRKPLSGAGKWIARHYIGDESYTIEVIATADDFSDADGVAILSYRQAQALARERMVQRAHTAAGKTGPIRVNDAMATYLQFLHHNRKTGADAEYRVRAFVTSELGEIEVAALTADRLRNWHRDLAKQPPRLRTRAGEDQKHRKIGTDDEAKRRRQASANRTLSVLKAALNHAFKDGLVPSDTAWRRVQPFQNVDAPRVRYLTIAEAQRLVNAADPGGFRDLVKAALTTGARFGELTRLLVEDFNPDTGKLAIRISKSGKARHVALTREGAAFFAQVCAGRPGSETMLRKANGSPWLKSHQKRPMALACKRARISPPIGFHILRHTWASHATMNETPLMVVAGNLGHADTRMAQRHYAHLDQRYVEKAIEAGAPRFGFKPDRKVTTLRRGAKIA